MRKPLLLKYLLTAAAVLCLQSFASAATDDTTDEPQIDPPERVARLSYLKGHVSFQSEDEKEWTEGSINRPLTTGDRLRVENNARAELQTGPVDIQLDERSDFSFLELNDDVAQMRITDGALYLSVRRLRDDEVVEIDTPQAAVAISKPGEYSIALLSGGARTTVRTYSGECEVTDHHQKVTIRSREQASFTGLEKNAVVEAASPRNAFDSWAHDRSVRGERSASSRYVDPDVIGYSDLDEYGEWVNEVEYGDVWIPRHVAVGWSPYRDGRWAWVSPWGWTWIDDAPWGFAPFHYGRWASVRDRWCWVPGPRHVRPVYAPALVAWVGSAPPRSSVSFSITFGGGIGWFPLAPREIYVPNYHFSRRYIHNINYANTVVINNVYINRAYNDRHTHFSHVNREVRGAVTVVRPDTFMGSRPVRDHILRVDQRELRNWETHNAISDSDRRRERIANSRRDGVQGGERQEREVIMRRTPSPSLSQSQASNRDGAGFRERGERGDRMNSPRPVDSSLRNDAPNGGTPNVGWSGGGRERGSSTGWRGEQRQRARAQATQPTAAPQAIPAPAPIPAREHVPRREQGIGRVEREPRERGNNERVSNPRPREFERMERRENGNANRGGISAAPRERPQEFRSQERSAAPPQQQQSEGRGGDRQERHDGARSHERFR